MIEGLIEARVRELQPANAVEQENAIQEVMQAYVLASLARSGFFSHAAFQGGTCLRMLYGMSRFSEDLDFLLRRPNPRFRWQPHVTAVREDCAQQNLHFEVQDRSRAGAAVQAAFLKTDSIGKVLLLDLPFSRQASRKIKIKLEIDTNPPAGSTCDTRYLTFPVLSTITTQTLDSGFATKSHALLCRSYAKGRDWYDFVWYVGRRTGLNYRLLGNALRQVGPWAGQRIKVTRAWYIDALRARIDQIDWRQARADVARFVPAHEQEGLRVWSARFFAQLLAQLAAYLPES
jgi:predicted nucleotidyltransferase component of viral defense system